MTTLVIKKIDDITIQNNLLYVNCGYRTSNIIPLAQIHFVSEVIRRAVKDKVGYETFCFEINNVVEIHTEEYLREDEVNQLLRRTLIYETHDKINTAMVDFHTNSIKISKPKTLDIKNHE